MVRKTFEDIAHGVTVSNANDIFERDGYVRLGLFHIWNQILRRVCLASFFDFSLSSIGKTRTCVCKKLLHRAWNGKGTASFSYVQDQFGSAHSLHSQILRRICLINFFYISLPFIVKTYICIEHLKHKCSLFLWKEGLYKKVNKANPPWKSILCREWAAPSWSCE